jgi:hypothetical protein
MASGRQMIDRARWARGTGESANEVEGAPSPRGVSSTLECDDRVRVGARVRPLANAVAAAASVAADLTASRDPVLIS